MPQATEGSGPAVAATHQPVATTSSQPKKATKRAAQPDIDKENSHPQLKRPRHAKKSSEASPHVDNSGQATTVAGTTTAGRRKQKETDPHAAAPQDIPPVSTKTDATTSGSKSAQAAAPAVSSNAAAVEVAGPSAAPPPAQRKGRIRKTTAKTANGAAPQHKAAKPPRQKATTEAGAASHKQHKIKKAKAAAGLQGPGAEDSSAPPAAASGSTSSSGKALSGSKLQNSRPWKAIIGYEPARVLAAAYAVAAFKYTTGVSQDEVEQAAAVVTTSSGMPLWEMDDQAVKVVKEDKHLYLTRTATDFPAGRQPFKAFIKHNLEALIAAVAGHTADQLAKDPDATAAADAAAARVLAVMEQPFEDLGAQLATAVAQAHREFWKSFRLAKVTEAERVERAKEANQKKAAGTEKLKNPSARPDRVAESQMLNERYKAINDRDSFGHVPGVSVNHMFDLRSEMSVLGVHKSPLGGIVSADIPVPIVVSGKTYKGVRAATSICMSGCYEDDHDSTSSIVTYTGEGGNDLLGQKKQVKGQELKRGNKALMANIALGIPVRLFRRNGNEKAAMNSVLFYDGLYDVVSWIKTLGKEGQVVYIFGLKRRAGQPPSLSKPIARFKESTANFRGNSRRVRENIIVSDLSKGLERLKVAVHNEVSS
eukprot:GHUV01020128.1.p1 GENE.GHUV01020128.1~~GHUV01020128.1.p1  ORF type:complete len:651 (+),score=201.01 GHUV01020128.1:688-2640(+)